MIDGHLRSPHNSHLTILARAGVPGLALWVTTHIAWAVWVLRCQRQSQRNGHLRWSGLCVFLLAFWLAALVNTSFDVYLESPMGAVWFWTVFGVGLAAPVLYSRAPDLWSWQDAGSAGTEATAALSQSPVAALERQ